MNKKTFLLASSIVFYVCAGVLAAYAIWSFTYCADIISQARAAGQLAASGNEYDIASFYMGNCGQFIVFALLLTAAGLLLQKKPANENDNILSVHSGKNKTDDDELDEWFERDEHSETITSNGG